MPNLQRMRVRRDVGQHVLRRAPHVGRHRESGDDAALQARDPHHEELVEVAGEDRQEVRPLEHRKRRILGELEHALVERQPAELAIQVAILGKLRVEALRKVEVVVVRVAQAGVEHLVFDHPLIIAG